MTPEHDRLDCPHEAARLLPWYVNGTLSTEDVTRVEAHLRTCTTCSADVERQTKLQSLVRTPASVEYSPSAGLRKLMTRIDEFEREYPAAQPEVLAGRQRRPTPTRTVRWLAAAVVIQAIGLATIGASRFWPASGSGDAPLYHTLTSAPALPANAPRIRIVFEPSMTLSQLRDLLWAHRLTIVSGPSESGIYTLALPSQGDDIERAVLSGLRADSHVRFAEPISSSAAAP